MEIENQLDKDTEQFCGFKVNNDYYAVPVLNVQEVIKPQIVTPVPLAQQYVRGLINLRGQIVSAISLRKLFGFEDDLRADHMNVIVRSGDNICSLVVDEILDVIELKKSSYEPSPDTLDENIKKFINGVYKLEGNLIVCLDLESIISKALM